MQVQAERELKWCLTSSERQVLLGHLNRSLGQGLRLAQHNRFFDSALQTLRLAGMSLRLRRENHRVILTCKRRLAQPQQGLHQHEEHEHAVNACLWPEQDTLCAAALPLPGFVRNALGTQALCELGSFHNLRWSYQRSAEHIALDCTVFAQGRVDYELEVETDQPESSRAFWTAQFAALGVMPQAQKHTKFARCLALGACRRFDPSRAQRTGRQIPGGKREAIAGLW